MKWIFCIFCSFIMFQSVAFAQEADTGTPLYSDNRIGKNILWLNGDLGIVRQLYCNLSDHILIPEKKQHQYYSIGFAYDYKYSRYGFYHIGADISKYKILVMQSEEGDDVTTYKSELTTFDPSLGLRFISPNLFSKLRVFIGAGLYMSIIRVNAHSDSNPSYYSESNSESFFDEPNFGAYASLGTFYKFTDNICSAISLNLKVPAKIQNAYDNIVYEAEADNYYPLFLYISFSVGYMY